MCKTQPTASDIPIYYIFVPQKLSLSKISNGVIACGLWFAPHPIKNLGYAYALIQFFRVQVWQNYQVF